MRNILRRPSGQAVTVRVEHSVAATATDPGAAASGMSLIQTRVDRAVRLPMSTPGPGDWAHEPQVEQTQIRTVPPRPIVLDEMLRAPFTDRAYVDVDLSALCFAYNQFCRWTLPEPHSFSSVVRWHDATVAHISNLPPWEDKLWSQVTRIQLYTDGTSTFEQAEEARSGASACVMFAWIHDQQYFVGFRTFVLPAPVTAQRAEHAAVLGGVFWLFRSEI